MMHFEYHVQNKEKEGPKMSRKGMMGGIREERVQKSAIGGQSALLPFDLTLVNY